MADQEEPILLFDGVCNLCSSSVQFVLKHNKQENIRFASLQSKFAKNRLAILKLDENYLHSLVFIENGKAFTKSDAALKLSAHLDGVWKLGKFFLIIPKFLRDMVYDFVAKHRYRWFGKSDTCWIPQSKWKQRFLD